MSGRERCVGRRLEAADVWMKFLEHASCCRVSDLRSLRRPTVEVAAIHGPPVSAAARFHASEVVGVGQSKVLPVGALMQLVTVVVLRLVLVQHDSFTDTTLDANWSQEMPFRADASEVPRWRV